MCIVLELGLAVDITGPYLAGGQGGQLPPKNRVILVHARFTRCKMAKRIKLGCSQTPLTSFFPR